MPAPPAGLRGQLVEHVPCETVTFDLGSTPPAQLFRLYVSMFGPATAATNSGGIVFGTVFTITQNGCSLSGYSQWCCNTGQDTTGPNFSLWRLTGTFTGVLIPAGTVTGTTMTAGQFNDTFLNTPVPLNAGTIYVVQMGLDNGFPATTGFWGTSGTGYRGLVNGPLEAFSDQGASNQAPDSQAQCTFGAGTNDPTAAFVDNNNGSFNAWTDVLISTG